MKFIKRFGEFTFGSLKVVLRGPVSYYVWMALLLLLMAVGGAAYLNQYTEGLGVTNLEDQLSWGFYIGNFAFLVGVAAAAVVLVVPAYVYGWGPTKEVVLLGELMAVAAIVMCMMFVTVDVGRPELVWHMLPIIGTPNFPFSMLTWDVLVLTAYLLTNLFVVTYLSYRSYLGRPYNPRVVLPVVFLSIPLAIGIHTVTAFLFVALPARPFWHGAILAPRFIASAFCSGPALLLLIFMILRKVKAFAIKDEALIKVGELMAYAMAVNLFLLGTEIFKELYYPTAHSIHAQFQWFGIDHGGHSVGIAPWAWMALAFNVTAFILLAVPAFRHKLPLLAVGSVLAFGGVYIEKGMGLLVPGMTPGVLGEIYEYTPSGTEIAIGVGIWGTGALLFTLMVKVAMAINDGDFRRKPA
jgi:Ni/Fe-hydrogenase subunit HybB-like protein